jgi:predicted oxidoreductase
LDHRKNVLLVDKDKPEKLGGLAKESFGGVHMIDTPLQRLARIRDSPELAWNDWKECARFGPDDHWPKAWAKLYCEGSAEYIWDFLTRKKVRFLPIVNWVERGLYRPYNTVPRWHVRGTGWEIVFDRQRLDAHPNCRNLEILFEHEVNAIETSAVCACSFCGVWSMDRRRARGGTGDRPETRGGDLSKLREKLYRPRGPLPGDPQRGLHDGTACSTIGAKELGGADP